MGEAGRPRGLRHGAALTDDIVLPNPDVDVDGVEDGEQREAPRDAVDDGSFALREELVDDGSEEKEVDDRPASH